VSRGFTLVEVLASLARVGLLAAFMADGLRLAYRTLAATDARREQQEAALATRFLARQLERADRLAGEPAAMEFQAPRTARGAGTGVYRFKVVRSDARLLLTYAPHDAPGAPREALLVDGVRAAPFHYHGENWVPRWPATQGLPRAVRIHVAGRDERILYFEPRLTGIRPEAPP
jgi:prepilin-type N-terminal cleavage/methylation domain-containing protein